MAEATKFRPFAEVEAFRAEIRKRDTHDWVDVSRHGSSWPEQCQFCGIFEDDVYGSGPDPIANALRFAPECGKRDEELARRALRRQGEEKAEWEALRKRRAYEQYLERTYGP